ncbi:hypothetical protein JYQ62_01495 [Nostoc sp. UHCC 0702]|nr:hypothetical protein JYQ62_01495 [Nostoc sp. UHCC 0702]
MGSRSCCNWRHWLLVISSSSPHLLISLIPLILPSPSSPSSPHPPISSSPHLN